MPDTGLGPSAEIISLNTDIDPVKQKLGLPSYSYGNWGFLSHTAISGGRRHQTPNQMLITSLYKTLEQDSQSPGEHSDGRSPATLWVTVVPSIPHWESWPAFWI